MKRILRLGAVCQKTGLSVPDIYKRMSAGTFPRQVPLGPKAVGWIEAEIADWIEARVAERDQPRPEKQIERLGKSRKKQRDGAPVAA